jgi:hypothetical protein
VSVKQVLFIAGVTTVVMVVWSYLADSANSAVASVAANVTAQ